MKTYKTMITVLASAILFIGCSEAPEPEYVTVEEEAVSDGFALGADISWVTQMEQEGAIFMNTAGQARECTALMKEIGMNTIRLRVWVDPEDGYCNKGDVLEKAKRAADLGMRVMIDFHYSDTWADPAKQVVPEAWLEVAADAPRLAAKVAEHTEEVLSLLKKMDVDVEFVQVGNEVTHGMLRHKAIGDNGYGIDLDAGGGTLGTNPANFAKFVTAGYDAVKKIYPEALVVIHVDRGHDASYARNVFNALDNNNGKYDVIGLSIYPESDDSRIASCVNNITALAEEYDCPVMICETGMSVSDPDKAYTQLSALIKGAKLTGHCLGVFYWEPQAPKGYNSGYDKGAFADNMPTHALDAFTEAAAE